jgi:acyl-CoA dehydrogenase
MSGERAALRDVAREFTRREVVPHLQEWEDAREVPRELHRLAAKQGLLGVAFPEDVGGEGGDLLDSIAVQEAMFEEGASSGLMAALLTSGIALPHIVASGNGDLIDRFVRPTLAGELIGSLAVTEPGGGSDVAGVRTTARRVSTGSTTEENPATEDDYLVNGTKTFITSGVRADFVTTAVRTGGPGHGGLSLLVVEKGTPGFTVDRSLTKMGWHCSDTAELGYADVRVPAANLVGAEGTGFAQIAEQFVVERIALAVHAYGIAGRSLALAAAYAQEREAFGEPLVAKQVVRHRSSRCGARSRSRAATPATSPPGTSRARTSSPRPAWPNRPQSSARRTCATGPCSSTAARGTCTGPRSSGTTATPGSSASAAVPPRC